MLLLHGANTKHADGRGRTPKEHASLMKRQDALAIFEEYETESQPPQGSVAAWAALPHGGDAAAPLPPRVPPPASFLARHPSSRSFSRHRGIEQQIVEAARDSALTKEPKASAAYWQGEDKWDPPEDMKKKFAAIKRGLRKAHTVKIPKSMKVTTHDKKVFEKTSSDSDSDPFDRVLKIKKMRWREEGGGCRESTTDRGLVTAGSSKPTPTPPPCLPKGVMTKKAPSRVQNTPRPCSQRAQTTR